MSEIGKLVDISAREAWTDESRDFTPWLAEHLEELSDVIGIPIEFEEREFSVASFSADIIARNPFNDARILIENQLERSDHKHLGQLMTYLAGASAQVVVWVAIEFHESHLAAIKWLNEHTQEPYAFFAVKLRVVRIGDSVPAPMFQVLERPNNWERQTLEMVRGREHSSELAEHRLAFWEMFLSRYPEFSEKGMTANAASNQWLYPQKADGLILSIYLAVNGVGVFLRGPRGKLPSDIAEIFNPQAEKFRELVGGEMQDATDSNHPAFSMRINMRDRENWPEAIDCLKQKADLWLAAIDELFGDYVE